MQRLAQSFRLNVNVNGSAGSADLAPEPLLAYVDATRDVAASGLWVWLHEERPVGILTIEHYPRAARGTLWSFEHATLSAKPTRLQQETQAWPLDGGTVLRHGLSSVEGPADSPVRRLQQMRQLARRFEAVQDVPGVGRIALRLMPNPVFRFPRADSPTEDGALFVFAHGTNPEVVLCLEAVEADNRRGWQYRLAAATSAEFWVTLNGVEVWRQKEFHGPQDSRLYINGRVEAETAGKTGN